MRLTLRTMLAYLDDVLEPADAQDIGRRIEESEFATNIVHRTRDVMRRLRLGAPKLTGRGMGLDPNTVAEYLDNTLPDDRVPDFEKVCLESDMHLAEVASCHQILALVLGEPAEVDPPCRQRMYALKDQAKAESQAAAAAPAAEPAEQKPPRKRPEVPEYLRQEPSDRRPWRAVAVVVLVLLAAVVALVALSDRTWLARRGADNRDEQPRADAAQGRDPSAALVLPAEEPQKNGPKNAAGAEPARADRGEDARRGEDVPAIIKPHGNAPIEAASPPGDAARSSVPAEAAPAAEPPAGEPAASGSAAAAVAADPPFGAVAPAPAPPKPSGTPAEPDAAARPPAPPAEAGPPADGAANPQPGEAAPPAAPPVSIGRFVATKQVLLKHQPELGAWQQVPPQETVNAGDRLLSPPYFRSTITLSSGVTVQLLGGTKASLSLGPEDVPVLDIEYGRAVVMTSGNAATQLYLRAGERQGLVTFGDSGSTIAVEVFPVRIAGTHPEEEPSLLAVDLYVASGMVEWSEPGGMESRVLEAPRSVALTPAAAVLGGGEIPPWIATDPLDPVEKKGAEFLAEYLNPQRSTVLGLRELAEHRRSEVRALAVQCLAHIGEFEPLIKALNQNDSTQRSPWSSLIDELRNAMARSPETAAQVRQALEKQRGESGRELYRMLWGYTADDLKKGADARLVEYLDHPDMDFRALAFWNLRELTGVSLFYRPDLTAEQRKVHVQKWRQRLAAGQIVPKEAGKGASAP